MSIIVVIDDQRINREIMATLAATVEENVEVAAFANPLEALAFVENKVPDLVITDFKMKPINGDEFIRRFRQLPLCGFVPAVVVTAFEGTEFRDRSIEAGATDFFQSPINHDDFQSRSRALLFIGRQRQRSVSVIGATPFSTDEGQAKALQAQVSATEMVEEMLQMVNDQFTTTVDNLHDTERDLALLSEFSETAVIFINRDFRIRRYTASATKIFDLGPDDVGEPLSSVRMKLRGFDPSFDLIGLTGGTEPMEKYVSTADARLHYLMRIVPYLDTEGVIDGAALTFTKIGDGRFAISLRSH